MDAALTETREPVDKSDVPLSHKELLDARRERVTGGKVVIHDWEDVKDKIGQRGTPLRQGKAVRH